jgi:hypothetical protein
MVLLPTQLVSFQVLSELLPDLRVNVLQVLGFTDAVNHVISGELSVPRYELLVLVVTQHLLAVAVIQLIHVAEFVDCVSIHPLGLTGFSLGLLIKLNVYKR